MEPKPPADRVQAQEDEFMNHDDTTSEDRELLELLRDYRDVSVPTPAEGFYDRALARAVNEGHRRQRRRWVMTGFGGAVAAAMALWIVSGVFMSTPGVQGTPVPSVTMALETPQTFNLVFSSATALEDATMTVVLPEGVEVDGFAGQREITWMTSLREGRNILPLTLVATAPVSGELMATLRHDNDDKTFRLQVTAI
jgi:hypothetical protein